MVELAQAQKPLREHYLKVERCNEIKTMGWIEIWQDDLRKIFATTKLENVLNLDLTVCVACMLFFDSVCGGCFKDALNPILWDDIFWQDDLK